MWFIPHRDGPVSVRKYLASAALWPHRTTPQPTSPKWKSNTLQMKMATVRQTEYRSRIKSKWSPASRAWTFLAALEIPASPPVLTRRRSRFHISAAVSLRALVFEAPLCMRPDRPFTSCHRADHWIPSGPRGTSAASVRGGCKTSPLVRKLPPRIPLTATPPAPLPPYPSLLSGVSLIRGFKRLARCSDLIAWKPFLSVRVLDVSSFSWLWGRSIKHILWIWFFSTNQN